MKRINLIILILMLFSCTANPNKNSLSLPPNFDELPDPNKKEKVDESSDAEINQIKDLLLED